MNQNSTCCQTNKSNLEDNFLPIESFTSFISNGTIELDSLLPGKRFPKRRLVFKSSSKRFSPLFLKKFKPLGKNIICKF